MLPLSSPAEILSLSIRSGIMLVEAQMVIGMRMMGMMGMWRVPRSENSRMVTEKVQAMQAAGVAAASAAMTGKSPAAAIEHALKPIQRRTRANAKRLGRPGPGKP
jgi:hypothetical protein